MLKYIISRFKKISISICLFALVAPAFCQDQEVKVEIDSAKTWEKYIPTGLRVGTDLITIVKNYIKDDYQELNFQADIDFDRYFFNVEYGRAERTFRSANATYQTNGQYFGLGPDVNFLHDPDNSALFFGFRYAFTNFSDELSYTYENAVYGDGTFTVANNNLKANWTELVAGMKVRMWGMLWLGYTARFKFGIDTFEQNDLIPTYVPGYGRADDRAAWGFNYYLILRIPVRKAPALVTVSPEG